MSVMVSVPTALEGNTGMMLAIIEKQDEEYGCHTDNSVQFIILMLLKTGMDAGVLYLCCRKLYTNFLSMSNLSIFLADVIMLFSMAVVLSLKAEYSHFSLCFILAFFSATYAALPLPTMCLLLLDYCLEDTCSGKQSALGKCLRNLTMTLLLWTVVVIYSIGSVTPELMELEYNTGSKAVVCEIYESRAVNYFTVGLFSALILALLPCWQMIPQWISEANRISEARDKIQEKQQSDRILTSAETKSFVADPTIPQPPLWLSLTLGFAVFWIPYLTVSVACQLFGFGVPPYITVNLLWVQCTNSVIVGVMFWIQSKTLGPYNRLPEDVCSWHVYWHLSKGTHVQKLAVFDPTKKKGNTHICV
ncbi:uncharacterized protein LOC115422965 [Sphaeramia orbicularis]|uniref:uncharacterized protein LOC115422965 n=1 Tax=Sphaeramia orbicularis TaxID=375764 RepID=UPI00117DF662|nr:uncharacterized protein LOC115422965 [Sphaeramia orbicularis]XP_029995482.1 uncharacterized protein LOC115422965 [Sphaeramia orbicularis]